MQTAGWLARTRDAADERRVIVTLTPTGRALRRKAAHVPVELAQSTGCSLPELIALTTQLQSLRDRMVARGDDEPANAGSFDTSTPPVTTRRSR